MPRTEMIPTRPLAPSLLARMVGAVRSYTVGPLTAKSKELARYWTGESVAAGVTVTEETAMRNAAVWAAITLISDDVASLPLMLYKRLQTGGKDRFEAHPMYRLLHDAPNPEMTSMVFRRTMQAHVLLWQNAYAEIERDTVGRPIALWPLVPDRVQPFRASNGALRYRVTNTAGEVTIDASNMLHLVGHSHDGSVGSSLVNYARESIGLALAAEKFGATFFGNGATFGGVISYSGPKPNDLSDDNYRKQLEVRHQGVDRAHKLLLLYNGAKFEQTGVEPNAAQFLETRVFQIREIARWFKIPPHKLADLADATFSNVEQQNLDYYTSCLRPWLTLWEQELGRKLIAASERNIQFIEHVTQDLLRADAAGRAALYTAQFSVGAVTPNEIRGFENMDPLPGGDRAFVQLNNVFPLDRIDEWVDAELAAKKGTPAPSQPVDLAPVTEQMNALTLALEARMAEHAARLAAESARAAGVEQQLTEKAQAVLSLQQEAEALRSAIAERDQAAAELEQRHAEELRTQMALSDEMLAERERRWSDERAEIQQLRDALQAEKNDVDVMLGVAEQEREQATRAVTEAQAAAALLEQQAVALRDELAASQREASVAQAAAAELRQQLTEQREQSERLAQEHAKAEAARVLAEAQRAEREAELATADARMVETSRAHVAAESRLQALAGAHRALIVDTIERLLQKEADRARKAQATPEKLRAWVENFYPLHAETCRAALRPVVLAWAPCAGADPERTLSELVQGHIEQSRRDLRLAADVDDADELAANVAQVLRRWETERAGTVADRLIAEGERYGH